MFILNLTNPLLLLVILVVTILLIFLAQEIKKSYIAAIPLIAFLVIIIIHIVQLVTLNAENIYLLKTIYMSIGIDFIFILITVMGYLWVDDIEARITGKKSIDNSLDWFWKKV